MSEMDKELGALMELREAVRCYLSWVWDARQHGGREDAIEYWEGEISRLSE
jgi:hypothetical protein